MLWFARWVSPRRWSENLQIFGRLRVVLLSGILFSVFVAYVLPDYAARSATYTVAATAPDLRLFYSPADLYAAAEAWGELGRSAYVASKFGFDVVWPLVYTFFLTAMLAFLLPHCLAASSRYMQLNVLPVTAMFLDFFENACLARFFAYYPAASPVAVEVAPWFTLGKWILIGLSFALILILAVVAARRGLRGA